MIDSQRQLSRCAMAAWLFSTQNERKVIFDKGDTPTLWASLCVCLCVFVPLALSATSAHHCLVLSRYPWWVGSPGPWDRQAFCGLSDRLCQMTRRLRCHHGPPWRLPSKGRIRANHTQADKWEEADWRTNGFNLSAQKTKLDTFLEELMAKGRNQWSKEHF